MTRLKAALRAELPGLRIVAVGDTVVRDRQAAWDIDSGQRLLDDEVAPVAGSVNAFIAHDKMLAPQGPQVPANALDWYQCGVAL